MKSIVYFSLPGNESLMDKMACNTNAEIGKAIIHNFPDGESYIRILSDVKDKYIVIICSLNKPDEKVVPLYFFCKTAKSLGAKQVCLVAPYHAYMRQDQIFHFGEGVTATYFAELISGFVDGIITIDPHLHRIKSLSEVYRIPNSVIHATNGISKWIKENVKNPVLIGPDEESKQWVSLVAKKAEAPFLILKKIRHSDTEVDISIPKVEHYENRTPVLLDDIISTAQTMIETVHHLNKEGMKPVVCIGIHAVFSGNAYKELLKCGVAKIVTCNTIDHPSNAIDLSHELSMEVQKFISRL